MRPNSPSDTPKDGRIASTEERQMIGFGAVTLALYLVNYWIQRSIFDTGAGGAGGRADALVRFVLYGAVTGLLFVIYAGVLNLCRRSGERMHGRTRFWLLAVPCVANLALIGCMPRLSQDVFSYIAHGYLRVAGGNPLTQAASEAAHTAIGAQLAAYGWHGEVGITPYGILWTQIEVAIMRVSAEDVTLAVILMKAVVVAASLGTAYLIWWFLGRVRPQARVLGTAAYLWNPLIVVEFAGEGHNDAVMLFFVVAGLAACAAQRPVVSLVSQLMGVLSKYVSLLFLPAQLVFLWRERRSVRQLIVQIVAAGLLSLGIAALLYAPIWAGTHSFDGLLSRGEPMSSATPFGGINYVLRRSPLASVAGPLTLLLVTVPLLVFVAWSSLRVKDAASLSRSVAWISVGYLLIASPDYWPWYACMPVALLAIADTEGLLWLVLLLSFFARLCGPLDLIRDRGFLGGIAAKGATTGLSVTLPLAILIYWLYRSRRKLSAILG